MNTSRRLFSALIIFIAGFAAGVIFSAWKLDEPASPPAPTTAPHRTGAQQEPPSRRQTSLPASLMDVPKEVEPLVRESARYIRGANYPKAVEVLNEALGKTPNNPDVLTQLGIVYRKMGKSRKAVEVFQQALKADPEQPIALFNLGLVYRHQLEEPEKALQAWETFLEKAGDAPYVVMVRPWVESLRKEVQAASKSK